MRSRISKRFSIAGMTTLLILTACQACWGEASYAPVLKELIGNYKQSESGFALDNSTTGLQFLVIDSETFGKFTVGLGDIESSLIADTGYDGPEGIGPAAPAGRLDAQPFFDPDAGTLSDYWSEYQGTRNNEKPGLRGFSASTSFFSDDGESLFLHYTNNFGSTRFAAEASWAGSDAIKTYDDLYSGSASVQFENGLDLTVSGGGCEVPPDPQRVKDPSFYSGKLAYRHNFFKIGTSAMALNYSRYEDVDEDEDEADFFALLLVQDFNLWGAEYFMGCVYYDLDRSEADIEEITSILSGIRVEF